MEISDEELKSLTTAILNRHGLDFTGYEPKSLKRRIVRAFSIFKINSVHELWIKILKEPDFIHPLVNELSVGLTSMFRDPQLWIRLKEVMKQLSSEKKEIRVWHAGCSSGEEIFTFNILLEEMGIRSQVKSLATDMNLDALETAVQGKYHIMKLADYEHAYRKYNSKSSLERYFKRDEKYGQMDLNLLSNVSFKPNNLITDELEEKFDIIFCRNVMIYFDTIAKKKVLEKFHNNLKDDGLFIIGYFDSLVPVIDKSKFEFYDLPHKIFKKNNSK